jgi:hypothetical protein
MNKTLCRNTLVKYLHLIGGEVVETIKTELKDLKFGLIFDGWSDSFGAHYVAIYSVHIYVNEEGVYRETDEAVYYLLACQPLLDETSFTAFNHEDFFKSTLELYGLEAESVKFLVGDNAEVNQKIARDLKIPLIELK